MAAAADVPTRYDVVINGVGYVFLDSLEPSLPFRTHRASYSYSPTFLERTNVGAAYGDNAQDFFLTANQNDFSLGEAQRFFRSSDQDRVRRYWSGSSVDPVTTPGQVSLRNTVGTLTFAGAVRALAETSSLVYAANATNVYSVDSTGTIVDLGAHGLGNTPSQWGITADGTNVYVTTTSSSTVGVRKYNGSSWSTFSATAGDSIAYMNNVVYVYSESTGQLGRYDTSGTYTALYTWKDGAGAALTGSSYGSRLRPFGGKLLVLRKSGNRGRAELWQYDGTNVSELSDFPTNFVAGDCDVVNGIVLVAGYVDRNSDVQPAIYYYVNSTTNLLWQSQTAGYTNLTWPAIAPYGTGLAFTDDTVGKLMQYNVATGGVHTIGTYTATNATPMMASTRKVLVHTRNSTTGYYFPTTTVATSGTVATSLFDFDNSLSKNFRSIKVDFDQPAGSTLDIAYQTDSVDSSYTTLQSGAASGTEYLLTSVSGRSISVKVTLNKGSSSGGPVLKRVYVRAAPVLQVYRNVTYVLDCTGTYDGQVRMLRDGTPNPMSGNDLMTNLVTAIKSQTPVSITDRAGTFTGVLEPSQSEIYEEHPGVNGLPSGEFVAKIVAREV